MSKIYLQQNFNKTSENQPDFRLKLIPEGDGAEFVEIGALWKTKSEKGYSGKLNENVKLFVEESQARPQAPVQKETAIEYPEEEEINPDDIPF